ncbi:hypothetical protein D3C71_1390210 [compost metagenome]
MLFDLVVILHVARLSWGAVVAAELPLTGVLVVDHLVVTIAIAEVDDLVRVVLWLVVEHRAARARAAAVRVPVVVGRGAPVAVPAIFVFQRIGGNVGLGVGTVFEVYAWQLYFTVLEVQCLADADSLTFEAVVFDPAAGQAQGQFVLVADTVGAGEAVVTEQRRKVEGVFAGVEYRNVFLVDLRHVQVEQTRL